MKANELQVAVGKVVFLLTDSGLLKALHGYRSAPPDGRETAQRSLRAAASKIVAASRSQGPAEASVMRAMRLLELRSAAHWRRLLSAAADGRGRVPLVHLHSKVLFASCQLPLLVGLLRRCDAPPPSAGACDAGLVLRLRGNEGDNDFESVEAAMTCLKLLHAACSKLARGGWSGLQLEGIDPPAADGHCRVRLSGSRDSVTMTDALVRSFARSSSSCEEGAGSDAESSASSGRLPILEDMERLTQFGVLTDLEFAEIERTIWESALVGRRCHLSIDEGDSAAPCDDGVASCRGPEEDGGASEALLRLMRDTCEEPVSKNTASAGF